MGNVSSENALHIVFTSLNYFWKELFHGPQGALVAQNLKSIDRKDPWSKIFIDELLDLFFSFLRSFRVDIDFGCFL